MNLNYNVHENHFICAIQYDVSMTKVILSYYMHKNPTEGTVCENLNKNQTNSKLRCNIYGYR